MPLTAFSIKLDPDRREIALPGQGGRMVAVVRVHA